jgi:hypothetical protein
VHKACLNSFTAAEPTPNGNGAAYNVLSTEKELLVQAGCNETTVDVLVGSGRPNQYVYRYGYERKGTKWQQFRLSGPPVQGNSDWFVGDGFAELTRTAAQLAGNNFVLAYICTWTGAEWKCGCRDNACTQSFWQLQNFWGQ